MKKNHEEARNKMNSITKSIRNMVEIKERLEELKKKASQELSSENFSNVKLEKTIDEIKKYRNRHTNNYRTVISLVNSENAESIKEYVLSLTRELRKLTRQQDDLKSDLDSFHKKYNDGYYDNNDFLYGEDLKEANSNQINLRKVSARITEVQDQLKEAADYLEALDKIGYISQLVNTREQHLNYSTVLNQEAELARAKNRGEEETKKLSLSKSIHDAKEKAVKHTITDIKNTQTILNNTYAKNVEENAVPFAPVVSATLRAPESKTVSETSKRSIEPIVPAEVSNIPVTPRDVNQNASLSEEKINAIRSAVIAEFANSQNAQVADLTSAQIDSINAIVTKVINNNINTVNVVAKEPAQPQRREVIQAKPAKENFKTKCKKHWKTITAFVLAGVMLLGAGHHATKQLLNSRDTNNHSYEGVLPEEVQSSHGDEDVLLQAAISSAYKTIEETTEFISTYGEDIGQENVIILQRLIDELRNAISSNDIDLITEKTISLRNALEKAKDFIQSASVQATDEEIAQVLYNQIISNNNDRNQFSGTYEDVLDMVRLNRSKILSNPDMATELVIQDYAKTLLSALNTQGVVAENYLSNGGQKPNLEYVDYASQFANMDEHELMKYTSDYYYDIISSNSKEEALGKAQNVLEHIVNFWYSRMDQNGFDLNEVDDIALLTKYNIDVQIIGIIKQLNPELSFIARDGHVITATIMESYMTNMGQNCQSIEEALSNVGPSTYQNFGLTIDEIKEGLYNTSNNDMRFTLG